MTLRVDEFPTEYEEIDRWDGGVGWIAHPDERMQRASHALAVDGEVWVVDPVDAQGIDDLFAEFGDVAGVVVTVRRHTRDASAVARRHDVPVAVPPWMGLSVDAPTIPFDDGPGRAGYESFRAVDIPGWREMAMYDEANGTLVVGEAVGSAPYFTTKYERAGVHPVLRLFPPKALRGLRPERILFGHGRGTFHDAPDVLADALSNSRRDFPKLLAKTVHELRH